MATPASSSGGAASPQRSPRHITLDGRTLEGGGQLVRNALALAALTGRPVTIDHVRGNRGGKTGLKASHAAAVKLLGEISGSKVTGGQIGSQTVTFEPPAFTSPLSTTVHNGPTLVLLYSVSPKPEYNIRLTTPGSVFLILQAMYPYLLWVGSRPGIEKIRVNITGGTNGTSSPSYDYAAQVMVPNFRRLGFPPLEIELHKRGWSTGTVDMGYISFVLSPLETSKVPGFPPINIMGYDRGKITRVDITILAPDDPLPAKAKNGELRSIRQYTEKHTRRILRKALKTLDPSLIDQELLDEDGRVPLTLTRSEATSHVARFYILLVADTQSSFKIGFDALGSARAGRHKEKQPGRGKHKKDKKGTSNGQNKTDVEHIEEFIEGCVHGFVDELSGLHTSDVDDPTSNVTAKKRSSLDQHMRDQIVVFEALGKLSGDGMNTKGETQEEDERYWTLHTKTAQWVCREMLGDR